MTFIRTVVQLRLQTAAIAYVQCTLVKIEESQAGENVIASTSQGGHV